ncbi:MAG: type IV pilin protein [Lachnospiraceae bacterium]|jgi:prepilin-type N-terminal cleavage/methylation domain-containing protein
MRKNNRKGFTLAELLIVVAIIAILVAISIPIFNNQLRKARLATNQANGRAAFSAAEAAYLDYVAGHGTIKTNSLSGSKKTVTYTYFTVAGNGILNFHYPNSNRWILDRHSSYYEDTDVSNWTVNTKLSDDIMIGDKTATVWTIHMNPENGKIMGYYCAFPESNETEYKNVLKSFTNGTQSNYQD